MYDSRTTLKVVLTLLDSEKELITTFDISS